LFFFFSVKLDRLLPSDIILEKRQEYINELVGSGTQQKICAGRWQPYAHTG